MTKKNVLVVDDEFHIQNVLALKLQRADFEVRVASNGKEALERIDELRPDLVITDFSMPLMNGVELVKEIRSIDGLESLPIIMLTARGQKVEETEGVQFKIDALLSKPFSPREVLSQVQSLLSVGV